MILPNLTSTNIATLDTVEFRGYNHTETVQEGEFYNMMNLTGDMYPVLTVRKPRGTVKKLTKPNGLLGKEKLCYVDGTEVFYDDKKIADVTDGEKTLCSMSAYICIFPDKLIFNISTGELKKIEESYTATGSVKYESSYLTDTDLDAEGQTYIKITSTGIGKNFNKYDTVFIEGSTITDINTSKTIQDIGDDYILIIGVIDSSQSQTGGLVIKRKCPDMDFVCEHDNRLWGCSSENREIYCCKLGDPLNWYSYEGLSTDSYAVTIGSDGPFTGCASYLGYIMFFKENRVHKVLGSRPSNFSVSTNSIRGPEEGSPKGLKSVNELLYYKGRTDILANAGSIPESISYALGETEYSGAVLGYFKNKLYISMKSTEGYTMFVYDTKRGLWYKEDNVQALFMTELNGQLYYIDAADNTLKTIEGKDTEYIKWYGEFGEFTGNVENKKFVGRLNINAAIAEKSYMDIYISYDNYEEWKKICTIHRMTRKSINIPIVPRRCDRFKIKIAGEGNVKIYRITKQLATGSEV